MHMLFRDTLLIYGLYHSIDIEKLLAYWTLVFQLCTETYVCKLVEPRNKKKTDIYIYILYILSMKYWLSNRDPNLGCLWNVSGNLFPDRFPGL